MVVEGTDTACQFRGQKFGDNLLKLVVVTFIGTL